MRSETGVSLGATKSSAATLEPPAIEPVAASFRIAGSRGAPPSWHISVEPDVLEPVLRHWIIGGKQLHIEVRQDGLAMTGEHLRPGALAAAAA